MSRCNDDDALLVKNKPPMLGREMSMSGVDVDNDATLITSHSAAVSRLRQLSRTFHQQRASSSAASAAAGSPLSPTVDIVPISPVRNQ